MYIDLFCRPITVATGEISVSLHTYTYIVHTCACSYLSFRLYVLVVGDNTNVVSIPIPSTSSLGIGGIEYWNEY